jgi:NADH dehydrogenase/NADH:ubiquinone oxidoreductase subunit G
MTDSADMSQIRLQMDGRQVTAREGMTLLETARTAGISIPTICNNEKLKPFGGCRLCIVEVEGGGKPGLVAACTYPAQESLVVKTRSERVDESRKMVLEFLLAHAPESEALQEFAREYKADKDRFPRQPSFCILCGLCVRYCAEVKQKKAVAFVNRGPEREIQFVPELAATECWSCKECFPLCPTSALQAAFVLTRSLSSFSSASHPESNTEAGRVQETAK